MVIIESLRKQSNGFIRISAKSPRCYLLAKESKPLSDVNSYANVNNTQCRRSVRKKKLFFNTGSLSGTAIMLKVESINSALLHKLRNKAK